MKKNEIYVEMLGRALPYIRNIQTQNLWGKATNKSCYYEAELVHNLPRKLLNDNWEDTDIHFLNYQAKYYCDHCSEKISPNYNSHLTCIKNLFKLVPPELRGKLMWAGPK